MTVCTKSTKYQVNAYRRTKLVDESAFDMTSLIIDWKFDATEMHTAWVGLATPSLNLLNNPRLERKIHTVK